MLLKRQSFLLRAADHGAPPGSRPQDNPQTRP
jgi:hypothetical protein